MTLHDWYNTLCSQVSDVIQEHGANGNGNWKLKCEEGRHYFKPIACDCIRSHILHTVTVHLPNTGYKLTWLFIKKASLECTAHTNYSYMVPTSGWALNSANNTRTGSLDKRMGWVYMYKWMGTFSWWYGTCVTHSPLVSPSDGFTFIPAHSS